MSTEGELRPALSVVIPVLNGAPDLIECLRSIQRQTEPAAGYEVLVVDGGSTDDTRQVAEAEGARVVSNPFRKAEPGVAVGVRAARGRFVTVMAADNRMRGTEFMTRILEPFADDAVAAAFPRVVSTAEDGFVNRYFNRYSDPFNHFVYGSRSTSLDVMLRDGRTLLRPTAADHPLLAMAQGCTVRAETVYQDAPEEADDVMAILSLVEAGGALAIVAGAELEHHHAAGPRSLYRKYRRRTQEALTSQQGFMRRQTQLSRARRVRRWLWVPYSASVTAPVLHGVWLAVRNRDAAALFHPVVNSVVFAAVMVGSAAAVVQRVTQPQAPADV